MKSRGWIWLALLVLASGGLTVYVAAGPMPWATAQSDTGTPSAVAKATLYVFSNSSPHISVIDPETNQVVKAVDLPNFTSWAWNDDNNYFDGTNLWLGLRNPDTNDVEVIALNLDTFEVTNRFPIGTDKLTLYIGKATKKGILLVSKMGSGQVVAIDTKAAKVLHTWDVPVNGDVVCDADIAVGSDGVERFYYPTRNGDTLVSLNPETGEIITVIDEPKGSTPLMMTVAPDQTVWVQETDSNTNAVFDPVTLQLIKRTLTGKAPIAASFSADGKYGFIGHNNDTVVTVIDMKTYEEVQRIQVGTNPQKLAVDPDGKYVYAILTREASVVVIDTSSWKVMKNIPLGTNPSGIYLRKE